jgi:hypothetical protein
MNLQFMEHRVFRLDLSSPEKPEFAICEVFSDGGGEILHYALNGACITAEAPEKIAAELDRMRKATEKPVLLESEMLHLTSFDIGEQLRY